MWMAEHVPWVHLCSFETEQGARAWRSLGPSLRWRSRASLRWGMVMWVVGWPLMPRHCTLHVPQHHESEVRPEKANMHSKKLPSYLVRNSSYTSTYWDSDAWWFSFLCHFCTFQHVNRNSPKFSWYSCLWIWINQPFMQDFLHHMCYRHKSCSLLRAGVLLLVLEVLDFCREDDKTEKMWDFSTERWNWAICGNVNIIETWQWILLTGAKKNQPPSNAIATHWSTHNTLATWKSNSPATT